MGRGIIQDVSAKIIDQFSENLATMLAGPAAEPEAAPPSRGSRAAAGDGAPSAAAADAAAPAPPPTGAAAEGGRGRAVGGRRWPAR